MPDAVEQELCDLLDGYGELVRWAENLGVSPEEIERLVRVSDLVASEFRSLAIGYALGRWVETRAGTWLEAAQLLDEKVTLLREGPAPIDSRARQATPQSEQ